MSNFKFYERGDVRIRYLDEGKGFPLLAIPGGGLDSRMNIWPRMATVSIDVMEAFKNDFRCVTMDHRNATGGESSGPIPVEKPWDAFADDHLGLLDHLGVDKFFYFGNCIGGSLGMKLAERAPKRLIAALISQTIGYSPEDPDFMFRHGRDMWAQEYRKVHPEVSMETVEKYLHNLYRAQPDFVYSVSRDFARSCQTPILVLPDANAAHPWQTSVDIASLCPNAEITVYPWVNPPELKARTIARAIAFLKRHIPS